MSQDLSVFILALVSIWFGAGMIVSSIDRMAKQLEISAFAVSFFILGFLTSLPEISVGVNSILEGRPEIYIGNLIGGSIILFILVIPLLAILGNGIKLNHQISARKLIFSLYVIGLPAILIIDGNFTWIEGILIIIMYFILFYNMEKKKGVLENIIDNALIDKKQNAMHIGRIIAGAVVVFLASTILVDATVAFSGYLGVSPFMLSLLGLSIGTNLPEISIAIRTVTMGKKDIALGDYVGSAAANSLILGILSIFTGQTVYLKNHFFITFTFMAIGLSLFYYFTRSKNDISRKEGLILLFTYFAFFLLELT